jgi:hypothetical protein
MFARTLAAAALFAALGAALAQPPRLADPKAAAKPDILKQLATRVTLEKGFEGKFKDALTMLAEKSDLPLVLTRQAEESTRPDGETKAGEQIVKLPKLTGVKAETVLTLLCEQTDTKFLVYPDHVRIVPGLFAAYESGVLPVSTDPNEDPPLLSTTELVRSKPLTKRALVNASFKNRPLSEVLDEIAESTGANVALSPLLPAEVRQAPITVRFANAPVDAAVRTLCEMTDTGVIEDANVLLVTTRERAAERAKEEERKQRARQWASSVLMGAAGFGVVAPDLATEVMKLREQTEQLKKQLDEVQKQLKK